MTLFFSKKPYVLSSFNFYGLSTSDDLTEGGRRMSTSDDGFTWHMTASIAKIRSVNLHGVLLIDEHHSVWPKNTDNKCFVPLVKPTLH